MNLQSQISHNIHKCNNCKTLFIRFKSYSHTVRLPKTKFPLKLDNKKLVSRDENVNKVVCDNEFYAWQRKHLSEPEFILHDGPPYANGPPHMGHAINKILKDTILRFKIINGTKVHYVPGWDCHGLPIELKACADERKLTPVELRSRARKFAKKTIEEQGKVFKSWGVMGDWPNSYQTFTVPYIKNQLKCFYELYKKNYIFRDFKPIYWSPSSRTALAEAELEYNESHISPSLFLRLKMDHINVESLHNKTVYALIWTTTPWTLPCNKAVCFNPKLHYCFVRKPQEKIIYIVAAELVESLSKQLNISFEILGIFSGELLSNATYIHPIYKDRTCKFIPASHVTVTKGTGLVHTAPAHGHEDFLVALDNKMEVVDLINEEGCYKNDVGEQLAGKFTLTEGNKTVLDLLKDNTLDVRDYKHSYPYDWRTKQPVIIKASKQWFIDTNALKEKAAKLLEDVKIIPKQNSENYKRNLLTQLQKRPYWCISRQRKWGVPIPVLHDTSNGKNIINENTISHYCNLLDEFGSDFWWNLQIDKLIPKNMDLNSSCIDKSQDILDIWFDSGITWSYVLGIEKVADVYLEGVDQFTGWFQSSLLTSVALREKAPYKSIYVHGFAVDENGVKMSKSLGNVIDPVRVMKGTSGEKGYGVDVLRWWVSCHANQDSLAAVSKNVLESCSNEIQKIRSVLRFALGALSDYTPKSVPEYSQLYLIDKYMLHLLTVFHKQVQEVSNDSQFNKVNMLVLHFLTNSVSALYYTAIKDRLYCDSVDSSRRQMAQFVLLQLFQIVTQAVAPIVPHLAEELYLYLPQKTGETFFTAKHSKLESYWENYEVDRVMNILLNVRKSINKEIGTDTLSSSVKLHISMDVEDKIKATTGIEQLEHELKDILQVAEVSIMKNPNLSEDFTLTVNSSNKYSCKRCRRVQADKENELCKRCDDIVQPIDNIDNKNNVSTG